ncbi:MAG TPA: O-antigen ligase family protein [Candidatus Scatomorpha stercorigallinarum]|nr:O-antigen ligase family protein [Candidatus Scatomorpha stercorigallinarum]
MKARWLTDKYISLMLLVFPLWTGTEGYAAITRGKFLFFAVLSALYLALLLPCALLVGEKPRRARLPQWFALAFMAAACLSAALSPYGRAVILGASRYDGLLTLLLYGGIFLGVSAFGEWKKYYVYLLAASASICSLVAIPQLLGGNPFGLYPGELTYFDANVRYTGEFLGTIGNTNLLAAFYCLCIPLFIWHALTHRALRDRLVLAAAALCLGVLIASRVASGAVALAAAAAVLIPYYVNYIHRNKRLTLAVSASMAALCVLALAAVYFYSGGSGTLHELSEVLHGHVEDSYGSSRVGIWRECLRLAGERPLVGGGPDTLALRTDMTFSRFVEETGSTLSTHVDNAHCEILGYLVNLGLLGALPYVALCAGSLRRFFRGCAPAAGGALCCYYVQSLFGLGLCIVVPLVWIYMGLVCSGKELEKCKSARSPRTS